MKRFLKETGVVRPTNKAFAFRQLEDALKWVEEREHPSGPEDFKLLTAIDLNDMPALACVSQTEREVLAQTVQSRTVHVGKKVFKKDQGEDCLFLVRSGLISTEVTPHKKDRVLLATVEPGDVLCGNRFQDNAGLCREAIAVEETEVFVLSRAQFDTLAAQHGTLAACLLDALAHTAARELASAATQLKFAGG
jgi:SulP family sulfate permease